MLGYKKNPAPVGEFSVEDENNLNILRKAAEVIANNKKGWLVTVLRGDVKEFIISGKRVRIAQVMTMDLDSLEGIRLALIEKMTELRLAGGEDDFVLVLTDILKETSKFIVVGPDAESIARSFDAEIVDSTFLAPGVLSRKKQVVPKITQALEK